jgi:hypothetical protein
VFLEAELVFSSWFREAEPFLDFVLEKIDYVSILSSDSSTSVVDWVSVIAYLFVRFGFKAIELLD